jgi:hypothetical protein
MTEYKNDYLEKDEIFTRKFLEKLKKIDPDCAIEKKWNEWVDLVLETSPMSGEVLQFLENIIGGSKNKTLILKSPWSFPISQYEEDVIDEFYFNPEFEGVFRLRIFLDFEEVMNEIMKKNLTIHHLSHTTSDESLIILRFEKLCQRICSLYNLKVHPLFFQSIRNSICHDYYQKIMNKN